MRNRLSAEIFIFLILLYFMGLGFIACKDLRMGNVGTNQPHLMKNHLNDLT